MSVKLTDSRCAYASCGGYDGRAVDTYVGYKTSLLSFDNTTTKVKLLKTSLI